MPSISQDHKKKLVAVPKTTTNITKPKLLHFDYSIQVDDSASEVLNLTQLSIKPSSAHVLGGLICLLLNENHILDAHDEKVRPQKTHQLIKDVPSLSYLKLVFVGKPAKADRLYEDSPTKAVSCISTLLITVLFFKLNLNTKALLP